MAVDFSQFTPKTSAQPTDYIVGYDANVSGGEKKYTVSTLANAVSSITSLGTVKSVTGTAPISVANGTTTPAISIAAATTSAAGSMSSTDKTRLDSASVVNGLVKCNGSGSFSAAVAGTDYVSSVSLSAYPTSAKAWVNFDGTLAGAPILKSYKVTSISDNGTGNYTINFAAGAISSTPYVAVATVGSYGANPSANVVLAGDSNGNPVLMTNSQLNIFTGGASNAKYDNGYVGVVIFAQ